MQIDVKTAESLSKKLSKFRATLKEEEAFALDSILQSYLQQALEVKRIQDRFKAVDDAVMAAQEKAEEGELGLASWTLTTITTTIASHPWITCDAKATDSRNELF